MPASRRGRVPAVSPDERRARDARWEAERAAALAVVKRAATAQAVAWLVSRRAIDPSASVGQQMRQLAAYRAGLGLGRADGSERIPTREGFVEVEF